MKLIVYQLQMYVLQDTLEINNINIDFEKILVN